MISKAVGRRGAAVTRFAAAAALLAAVAAAPAHAQGTLTGTTVYSTGSNGAYDGVNFWNTVAGDGAYNVFLSQTLGGAIINPAGTLSTPLAVGTNTFYLYASPGSPLPYFGVSLFINGNTSPLLSGYAAANGAGAVSSNAGLNSLGMTPIINVGTSEGIVPAGPLTTTIDGFQYTLTFYAFNTTGQFGDRVNPDTASPDATADFLGQFVITVAPAVSTVPEPSTVVLTASGLLGLLGVTVRRRTRAATL